MFYGLAYLTQWSIGRRIDQRPKLPRSERCEKSLSPCAWQKRITQYMCLRMEAERISPRSHSREGGNPGPLDGCLDEIQSSSLGGVA